MAPRSIGKYLKPFMRVVPSNEVLEQFEGATGRPAQFLAVDALGLAHTYWNVEARVQDFTWTAKGINAVARGVVGSVVGFRDSLREGCTLPIRFVVDAVDLPGSLVEGLFFKRATTLGRREVLRSRVVLLPDIAKALRGAQGQFTTRVAEARKSIRQNLASFSADDKVQLFANLFALVESHPVCLLVRPCMCVCALSVCLRVCRIQGL